LRVDLFAEQRVHRHIERTPDGIEARHLQTRAEVIAPHNGGGIFVAREFHIRIRGGAPSIIKHRLAKPDDAIGQFHFANLSVHPMRQLARHAARGHGAVRQIDGGAADVFDTQPRLIAARTGDG